LSRVWKMATSGLCRVRRTEHCSRKMGGFYVRPDSIHLLTTLHYFFVAAI
jgi:hypothetical protein